MQILSEAKISPVGKINIADIKSIVRSTLIFIAPAILIYLGQLQGTLQNDGFSSFRDLIPNSTTLGSIYGWLIGILINIFLKFRDGGK